MPDLLLIDLDDTLIDRELGFERWARWFLRSIGRDSDDEVTWLLALDAGGLTSRVELFGEVTERYGLPDDAEAMVDAYLEEFPRFIPSPSDDTLSALAAARRTGWKICIVTNGSRRTQERKIADALATAVDGWVISEAVGAGKPDPEVFHAAAEAVGVRLTASSWVMGDRPETDVLGAVRLGVRSAWISRGRIWDSSLPFRPTPEAATVSEALYTILAPNSGPGDRHERDPARGAL